MKFPKRMKVLQMLLLSNLLLIIKSICPKIKTESFIKFVQEYKHTEPTCSHEVKFHFQFFYFPRISSFCHFSLHLSPLFLQSTQLIKHFFQLLPFLLNLFVFNSHLTIIMCFFRQTDLFTFFISCLFGFC